MLLAATLRMGPSHHYPPEEAEALPDGWFDKDGVVDADPPSEE
jgi:hypothetical protein